MDTATHRRSLAPAALLPALLFAVTGACAQGFALEGAVIDSRDARNLGVINERGDINTLFRAQKAMTYGILRSAGIDIELLPPDIRARVERFATNNLEAFRAFSQGLDLKDQGKFVEAKEAFRRAAELDPNFALAVEQQRAMPDTNLGLGVQTRAVLVAAAATAVDRGKATIAIDTARAQQALSAGQSVVIIPAASRDLVALDYSVNQPGSTSQLTPSLAAALSYGLTLGSGTAVSVAAATEWRGSDYRTAADGTLESLGSTASGFLALRQGATVVPGIGSGLLLGDGVTKAYWGSWLSQPGASASVTLQGVPVAAPALGRVDYVQAEATRQMPTSNTAVFAPAGGALGNVSGTVAVNFATRTLELRSLGFDIGTLSFGGLNGVASYNASSAAGTFKGNYSSGACTGCSAFVPQASVFGGTFAGRNADAVVFSTFLQTGQNNFAAGVHLFTKNGP